MVKLWKLRDQQSSLWKFDPAWFLGIIDKSRELTSLTSFKFASKSSNGGDVNNL